MPFRKPHLLSLAVMAALSSPALAIEVDGRIDPAEWEGAQKIADFKVVQPLTGAAPAQPGTPGSRRRLRGSRSPGGCPCRPACRAAGRRCSATSRRRSHFGNDLQINDAGYLSRNSLNYLHWQASRRFTGLPQGSRYASKDWRWRVSGTDNNHGDRLQRQFRRSQQGPVAARRSGQARIDDTCRRGRVATAPRAGSPSGCARIAVRALRHRPRCGA